MVPLLKRWNPSVPLSEGAHTPTLCCDFRTRPALLIPPLPYSAGDSALDSSSSWGRESMLGHGSSSSYVFDLFWGDSGSWRKITSKQIALQRVCWNWFLWEVETVFVFQSHSSESCFVSYKAWATLTCTGNFFHFKKSKRFC